MPNPSQEPAAPSKAPNVYLKAWMFFAPSKSRKRNKIQSMGLSKTSDHIQIKIKMPNPSHDPPGFSKAPNKDFMDLDVLGTFKIKTEWKNIKHRSFKD